MNLPGTLTLRKLQHNISLFLPNFAPETFRNRVNYYRTLKICLLDHKNVQFLHAKVICRLSQTVL